MTELRFFNALGRSKQVFESLTPKPGPVRIYSCGPTVYSRQHLGNMRPYVFADVLKRTLRLFGYQVKHVINITDVGHLTDNADCGDDKMELAASKSGESVWDIARRYTELFQQDLQKLGVEPPDVWSRATDHIPEQIAMIETLARDGYAYRLGDGIYFDTSRTPHYGELTGGDRSAQEQQERICADEKRNPADFALWKLVSPSAAKRQMEWDSPWGRGFPGWHIECSAMAAKYLGVPFDIHTGGIDHIPVHHTNEIVQTESATGVRPCVRYWMHNGWLMIDGEKISKSKGHTANLDDLIERKIEPLAFRYFLLSASYRQQMNFNAESIAGAQSAYRKLVRHAADPVENAYSLGEEAVDPYRMRFESAMGDDLNTPQALAVVWEMVRSTGLSGVNKRALLHEFDSVLGLGLRDAGAVSVVTADPDAARIDALVAERDAARKAKNFARSDAIRDQLKSEGIVLEDVKGGGTRWHRA